MGHGGGGKATPLKLASSVWGNRTPAFFVEFRGILSVSDRGGGVLLRFVCRGCGAAMGEVPTSASGVEASLRALGLEQEDAEDWIRADMNDQVVIVRTACDRCLARGYDHQPIWYN
jgi:hypothetical protein